MLKFSLILNIFEEVGKLKTWQNTQKCVRNLTILFLFWQKYLANMASFFNFGGASTYNLKITKTIGDEI